MAELADARDLKSRPPKGGCGFDPRPRHQSIQHTFKTPVERFCEKFQFPDILPLKPRFDIVPSQDVAVRAS